MATEKEETNEKHYIDNVKFYEAFIAYKQKVKDCEESGKPKPRIPEYIGLCI